MRNKERQQRRKERKVQRRNAFRMEMKSTNLAGAMIAPTNHSVPTTNSTQTLPIKKIKRKAGRLKPKQIRARTVQKPSTKLDENAQTSEANKILNGPNTSTINSMDRLTNDSHSSTLPPSSLKGKKFRKFRDTQKSKHSLNSANNTTTSSQIVTRRLLRSIKRRQLRSLNASPKKQCNASKKLNSSITSVALEEGEIVSDEEQLKTNKKPTNSVEDNDDDCVCIEPEIEKIVIEDDMPSTSRLSAYISLIDRIGLRRKPHLFTSTPLNKSKALRSIGNNTKEKVTPIFYEDLAGTAWKETVNSDDTFNANTKQTTLGADRSNVTVNTAQRPTKQLTVTQDVIVLDDSSYNETIRPMTKQNEKDDSVIFISETQASSKMQDFIPLVSDNVPNPLAVPVNVRTPSNTKPKSDLFTTSEKKQLCAYNVNTYNPNEAKKLPKKRLVIIDGSNVAFHHSLNKEFSTKGLKICIDYFEKMGHEVKAVLPKFRLHKCSDPNEMEQLHSSGKIVLTPCKSLPGKFSISYDDRFVLQLAAEMDAAIVSNDNYRDLINENKAFKKLVENRVIGFTWCNDIFMVAKDPYGKWGPSLQTILNRSNS